MGIVVFGAVFVDIKGYPTDIHSKGPRNVGRIEQVDGGVGRNVAEDIANVELRPTFVSIVDTSPMRASVIARLKRHKVNTDYILKTEDGMGTWLAIFDHSGDVTASISKRPDLMPIMDVLEEHGDEIISTADSVVVEIDMDKELLKKIFKLAEKYNKTVYAIVSNMNIAMQRRDLLKSTGCIVCNLQEAEILFSESYEEKTCEEMAELLAQKVKQAQIPKMIITMGGDGAVYAEMDGDHGYCPAQRVDVKDTTGAGDAFFSGVTIGLTYGKKLGESCEIGSRLAASVICTTDNVCPRFLPSEFNLELG